MAFYSHLLPLALLAGSFSAFAAPADDTAARIAGLNGRIRSATSRAARRNLRTVFTERAALLRGLIADSPRRAETLLLPEAEAAMLAAEGVEVEAPFTYSGPATSGVMDFFEQHRALTFYSLRAANGSRLLGYSTSETAVEAPCSGQIAASGWRIGDRVLLTSVTPSAVTTQCTPTGDQRVAVFLVYPPNTAKPATTAGQVTPWFFGDQPDSIKNYYAQGSYGKLRVTGKVFGWYQLPRQYDCGDMLTLRDDVVKLAGSDVDFSTFDRLHFVLQTASTTAACTWGGVAYGGCPNLTTADGVNPASSSFSRVGNDVTIGVRGTATHELGHNFGVGHARTVKFPGDSLGADRTHAIYDEYGDPISVMGSGNSHFAAPHKYTLTWLVDADITTVEQSGDFTLNQLQASSGTRALRIRRSPGSSEWIWLEYRSVPNEWTQWSNPRSTGALLHYVTPLTGGYTELLLANPPDGPQTDSDDWELLRGSIWQDRHGPVRIELGAPTPDKLAVRVRYDQSCASVNAPAGGVVLTDKPVTLPVTASDGCMWSAVPDELWMNAKQSTLSGAGTITITPAAMPQFPRSGSITVARTTVPVQQLGQVKGSQIYRVTPDAGAINPARSFHSDLSLIQIPGNDVVQVHLAYGPQAGANKLCSLIYDVAARTISDANDASPSHGAISASSTKTAQACNLGGMSISGGGVNATEAALSWTFQWTGASTDTVVFSVRFVNRDQSVTDWTTAATYQLTYGCAYYPANGRLKISGDAATVSTTVDANAACNWTAATTASWLKLTTASGTGRASLTLAAEKNASYFPRTALITLADRTIEVWQPAGTSTLTTVTMLPGELEVPAAETTLVVRAQDSPHLNSIDIASNNDWIELKGVRGTGPNGNIPATWWITLNVAPNRDSVSRRGSISIGPIVYDVVQDGSTAVVLSPPAQTVGASPAIGVIKVDATADTNWTAASNQSWLTFDDGSGTGTAALHFRLEANRDAASRTALVTVAGMVVSVTQAGADSAVETTYIARPLAGLPEDNVQAMAAGFDRPGGMAFDSKGNMYVAEKIRRMVFRIAPNGVVTRVAGNGLCCFAGDGGDAVLAALSSPDVLAVDAQDRLYISDRGSCVVRRVENDGTINSVAGTGNYCSYAGDGGPATAARLNQIGIAIAADGSLLIADTYNNRVRKVDSKGVITTIAGTGAGTSTGDGGPVGKATIYHPESITLDRAQNLYIAESDANRIRMVASDGTVSTLTGTGTGISSGDGGAATAATINHPTDLQVDASGDVFFAEMYSNRIRRFTPGGSIRTVLNSQGRQSQSGDGGPAAAASAFYPARLALDTTGNLYFTEGYSTGVRRISPDNVVDRFAGIPDPVSATPIPVKQAHFVTPAAAVVAPTGEVYVAESDGRRVQRIGTDGVVTVIAGDGGYGGTTEGKDATKTSMLRPVGLALMPDGELIVVDVWQNRIIGVSTSGITRVVAGTGQNGYSGDGGPAKSAKLNSPHAAATDAAGNIYVADDSNCVLRKIDTSGTIQTIAGNNKCATSPDGSPATSSLYYPEAVAVDPDGTVVFVEATWPRLVRSIGADGKLTTLLDTQYTTFYGNPMSRGAGGMVYSDASNRLIRRFLPLGGFTRVAGSAYSNLIPDFDVPAEWLMLREPESLAGGPNGTYCVIDSRAARVYMLLPQF